MNKLQQEYYRKYEALVNQIVESKRIHKTNGSGDC